MYKSVYINSFDSISCAGDGNEELFTSICEKRDSISQIESYIENRTVALGKIKTDKAFLDLLLEKCKNLLEKSNLDDFSNTLLIIGSSVGGMSETESIFFKEGNYKNIDYKKHPIDAIANFLKENFQFYDDLSFSTACTSSANALGYAKEVISKGFYKNVLVIGVDSLSATTVNGFNALSVLSSSPCRPFDKSREGMNVSEAIALLLLQDDKTDKSIKLCGVGYSSDAHHMTQPQPEGLGAFTAMTNALSDANLHPSSISYINAHGTGTLANDSSELNAIVKLFKDCSVNVSSTKSITGHTLGAAGAIEAIISCLVLQNQIIVPNKNLNELEEIELGKVEFPKECKKESLSYVLSNSFAFGGNNTSLVFGLG